MVLEILRAWGLMAAAEYGLHVAADLLRTVTFGTSTVRNKSAATCNPYSAAAISPQARRISSTIPCAFFSEKSVP